MSNIEENSYHKINLNWYPGHMAKTKRQIMEDLKLIDVVIELIDARIPISSRNPDINEITKNKKKIVVLNKSDLADDEKTRIWKNYYEDNNVNAVIVDSNTGKGINECIRKIEKIMEESLNQNKTKGRVGRTIRVMILGVPNVGKSSFINRIAKRNSANVGNKPGVTRQKQWVRVSDKIELLDTPGVLWPKFESEKVALNLAFTGTIKDDILDKIEIAYYLLKFLLENYKNNVIERYKLNLNEVDNILQNEEAPENENIMEIFYLIGKKRGAIVSGGQVDEQKVANILIDDFRNVKLGKITLEII